MTTKDDGGPAFPLPLGDVSINPSVAGMTVRDYFAAKALQSVLDGSWPDLDLSPKSGLSPIEESAVFAYEIADAMLAARSAA